MDGCSGSQPTLADLVAANPLCQDHMEVSSSHASTTLIYATMQKEVKKLDVHILMTSYHLPLRFLGDYTTSWMVHYERLAIILMSRLVQQGHHYQH